jgi:hypothetical protein
MAQRILVLKPLYGCAIVTQLDGSIQLHYNTTHTPDEKVFEWLRHVADAHSVHVEQNMAAEMRAAVQPKEPITVAAIVAPVMRAPMPKPVLPVPVIPHEYLAPKPLNPSGQDHTTIGPYRIGKQCIVCHAIMSGNEGKCPGEIVIVPPEEKP